MIAKIVVVIAILTVAHAGHDAPPPKAHTYNVPVVSKVSYPGQTLTRSVETYSAPSIEKTTTITRSVTAPLNAPAERHVSYAAPTGPVVNAGLGASPVAVGYAGHGGQLGYAAPAAQIGYAAPVAQIGYAAHAAQIGYSAPAAQIGYAAPAIHSGYAAPIAYGGYAAPAIKAYSEPTLSLGSPPLGLGNGLGAYAAPQGLGLATTYSAPALGYNLGGPAIGYAAGGYAAPSIAYAAGGYAAPHIKG